jgi:HlyD family secretion protein
MSSNRKTLKATSGASEKASPSSVATHYRVGGHILFATAAIAALVFGCGGWAATAELAGAVISQGSVVVERHVKKIQHRDGGIVAAINVKNGDRVEKGVTLIRLYDTVTLAELAVVQSQLTELMGRTARLTAERDSAQQIAFPSDFGKRVGGQSIIEGEQRLFDSGRNGRESQREQLRLRIGQLREEIVGISAQRDAKVSELRLFRKELEQVQYLFSKNLIPSARVFALQREEARISGEYGNFVAQAARVAGQISETDLQILNIDLSLKTEAQRELRSIEGRISELKEREITAKDRLARTLIRAPQSGIVHELSTHTVGGIVTAAETIMLIVPEGDALSIELRLPPISIDQVHLGQDVRLRFTSFNQRTTPEMKGRISYVSADISQDSKTRQDYYSARVELVDAHDWKIEGRQILPGMPVEAYVTTEKRTALSYLVKPIVDQFSRAFRER